MRLTTLITPLTLGLLAVSSTEASAQMMACQADTAHRTAYERLLATPGAAVTEQTTELGTLSSAANGSKVRLLRAVATDAVSGQTAHSLIIMVVGQFHRDKAMTWAHLTSFPRYICSQA